MVQEMRTLRKRTSGIVAVVFALLLALCMSASADSGDNSLYSLGLENAVSVTPEFYYSTLEYDVVVPAGTTELELNPVTSNSEANVIDISGEDELDENGAGTVYITVEAPNGAQVSYTLHVTAEAAPETEPTTEKSAEDKAREEQEALQRQSESEAAARQAAELESARQQIDRLVVQNADITDRMNLLMKVMYGLIGFAVLLLFFIINQSLRNKDLKDDLKEAKSQAEMNNEFARKEQSMPNGYYYNTPQAPVNAQQAAPADASRNVQAAFGNAPQMLHATGQPAPAAQPAHQPASAPSPAPQPDPAPEPTLVQGSTPEPDVNVEMVDL